MTAEVTIKDGTRLTPHPLRAAVLGELHARPFTPLKCPCRILHFAFATSGEAGRADRAAFAALCTRRGLSAPQDAAKQHRVALDGSVLRWEQHSEFTTYTWELPGSAAAPFDPPASALPLSMQEVPQPGPLLVALDVHLISGGPDSIDRVFDPATAAVAESGNGEATFATDFQTDAAGFVRILVLDRGMSPERAGALVQRLVELETYRTLALLGLPEAQRLAPSIGRVERRLAETTEEMRGSDRLMDNRRLLDELTALAAEVEAGAAASLFRFGASRAYNEIVQMRLPTIGERQVDFLSDLELVSGAADAACDPHLITTEERQANLSQKLARAANLLRTRVDVEVEQQNRDLLKSMNARTRLQLRLQTTVEGLSVAAISYYVVGLFGHVLDGVAAEGVRIDVPLATALFVPIAVVAIWWMVRRIRRRHIAAKE